MKKGRCSHSTYFDPVQRAKHYKRRITSEQRLHLQPKRSGGAPFALHTELDEEHEARKRYLHQHKRRNRRTPGGSPSTSTITSSSSSSFSPVTERNVAIHNRLAIPPPATTITTASTRGAPSVESLCGQSRTYSQSPSVVSSDLVREFASDYELEQLKCLQQELRVEERKRDAVKAELERLVRQRASEGAAAGLGGVGVGDNHNNEKQDRFVLS